MTTRVRWLALAAALLAASLVTAATDVAGGSSVVAGVADAAVGLLFALVAATTRLGAPRERILLGSVGVAWLIGGLAPLAGLHRAVLVQALLAFPDGRLGSWWRRAFVLLVYVVVLTSDSAALSACAFAATAVLALAPRAFPARSSAPAPVGARLYPVLAASLMAIVLVAGPLVDWLGSTVSPETLTAGYEAALALIAVTFPVAVAAQRRARADVRNLVVQLGPEGGLTAFASALGKLADDASLRVVLWDPTLVEFVDEAGVPVARAVVERALRVDDAGQPLALVLHHAGTLTEPGMVRAVEAAVRLAVRHTRLRNEELAQVGELNESRRRVLASADAQRLRIADRLHARVEEPARRLAVTVERLEGAGPEAVAAATELRAAVVELEALADGLRPPTLDRGGLSGALGDLAERSALPVRLTCRPGCPLPVQVETVVYFVCAEAVANAIKHSAATQVAITVTVAAQEVRVVIEDDGVGGADPSGGTGLRGLVDRVAAVHGRLAVRSPVGGGTSVTAELPVSADPKVSRS
jgi:signal transduction histidine kinase